MKTNLALFCICLAAFAGFFLGKGISKPIAEAPIANNQMAEAELCQVSPKEASSCAELESFKEKLHGISPQEIRDYLKIQSAEEKLKKADEILGRIVTALVATVGFRMNQEELKEFGKNLGPIDNQPPAKPLVSSQPTVEKTKSQALPSRLSVDIQAATTEVEAQKILGSLGSDFSKKIQSSSALTPEILRELNGRYEGLITFAEAGRGPYRTTLVFRGRRNEETVSGSANIQIFNASGQRISNGSSRGNLTRSYSGLGPVVFMECGSDYFEMVYFPNLDQWMGNFLEPKKGMLEKTGTVVLRRIGG